MSGWTLRTKQLPSLRVDLRGVTPDALAALSLAKIERIPVGHGNAFVPLAELFHIEPRTDDALVFAADLARFDRVGWQMDGGRLIVEGAVGDYAGAAMRGGEWTVHGNAGDFLASRMVAGTVAIGGSVGAHVGYGMRRGSVVFARETPDAAPDAAPTFVPAIAGAPVFWQLLARDLARHGGIFATLPSRRIERRLGDLAAGGKGELIAVT